MHLLVSGMKIIALLVLANLGFGEFIADPD